MDWDELLGEQIAYYEARAPEYDDGWSREGSYDLGAEFNRVWLAEADRLHAVFDQFAPRGDVLELAAGTGIWTTQIARYASSVTAVDTSSEALAINAAKLASSTIPVRYIQANVFEWRPDRRYDVVCFAFWLSHVPKPRFEEFWSLVDAALAPGGRVFFADNAPPMEELPVLGRRFAMREHTVDGVESTTDLATGISVRRVRDGREFRTIKVFWTPEDLQARLADLGWNVEVDSTEWAFVYGYGSRSTRNE